MNELYHIANILGNSLRSRNLTVTTAESCTGGGIAYALTSIPGSSQWFNCGWVTYSNESKQKILGVDPEIIEKNGAVSESVVRLMAEGALVRANADVAIAVSGIAGPGGGTPEKPVGTVWIAWATKTATKSKHFLLPGDREHIRRHTIIHALQECEWLVKSLA